MVTLTHCSYATGDYQVGDRVQIDWKEDGKIYVYGVVESVCPDSQKMVVRTDKATDPADAKPQDNQLVTVEDRTNGKYVLPRNTNNGRRYSMRVSTRRGRVNYSQVIVT